ncbi:TonB-dependent receptor [Aerosticca soli]|uniref:Predicted sucrose-specific TonB-dependent receptor n=1 Tax=Aerosticca soli TaxID=2010829 RepID=A0A2Z6E167_9GAMM|nr:TonB-dependent receptor [Aerosticca soli]BBD78725.1 predicted sucrose-specific TonB-dependent receptor [Aerosticca soli]
MYRPVLTRRTLVTALWLALLPAAAVAQTQTSASTNDNPAPGQEAPAAAKKAVNLDQMVVTASPAALSKMSSSISVSSLEADQILDSGALSAADILRDVPGIRAESSGGDGNANVSVRGLPVASGGSKFAQFQIDGMPVLEFGDTSFATPDTFLRPDFNIDHVEVVRGGSSSVFASNAPGAVFNFITKTGEEKGGDIGLTTGVNYDSQRLDFDYGQPLDASTRFHVGGFFRDGEGPKTAHFTTQKGGQLMGNLTHDIDGGFLRLSAQYLNDRSPAYLPVPVSITGSNGDPLVSSLPGFNLKTGTLLTPRWRHDLALEANGHIKDTDLADGYHSIVRALGGEGLFTLADGWTLHEQFRYADNSGDFVGPYPAEVNTAAALAQEIGGAGATLRYATGPMAGQVADPATVGNNGLATRVHLFNVTLPNMGNFTNDLKLKHEFDFAGGPMTFLAGYYHSRQNIRQDWHWNTYLETVQGQRANLLDVYDATGRKLTQNGLVSYGTPYWGIGTGLRAYNTHYDMDAPYLSLSWQPDRWQLDAGVRYDHMRARGGYTGVAGVKAVDMNGDGVIEGPEQSVPYADASAHKPVDYDKHHLEYSFGANYLLSEELALFARASRGARFNADRLLFGGGILDDGSAPDGVAINEVKQYEGGVKWNTRHTSLFVTGFYATTEEQNQDVTSLIQRLISRKYRSKGVEIEGSLDYGMFSLRGGVTYTHSRIIKDAITPEAVGDTPQRQAKWVYQIGPSWHVRAFDFGATAIGTSKSYASNPNGLVMPAYTQVNAFVRYAIDDHNTITLQADNVFNVRGITEIDQSPVSVTPNGLNTARSILGRTIYASWRYRL